MTALETTPVAPTVRLKLAVRGAVQGVGFRPFVYRLANELGLTGWVINSPQGVFIEVEGSRAELEKFWLRLEAETPPRSFIQSLEASWLNAVGYEEFEIRASETLGDKTALVLPDIGTCPECWREVFDPTNRRYHYPFTNCTHCGPRFSIIESLPYDRANTSMKEFTMCPTCQAEYDDPRDRRFHAQPNACPDCGPQLELWNASGDSVFRGHDALLAAADAIRHGQIVAVEGIGGFHLMVDVRSEEAVRRLRERKHREEKPLALMFPTLESVREVCQASPLEERLLRSPESPIVLLERVNTRPHPGPLPQEKEDNSAVAGDCERVPFVARSHAKSNEAELALRGTEFQRSSDCCSLSPGERVRVRASVEQTQFGIAASVAPGNPNLGVMLPSNPLHHLLMAELRFPVVATSGNLNDEPICTDEREAVERLGGIADLFLVHNRPIVRHVDDSIVRVMLNREMVLRRARGYAPLPITVAAGILPAVEPGLRPGGKSADIAEPSRISTPISNACAKPGGKMPPSTAGRMPAATILAVGAHLKNTVALAVGDQVFLSQHIGDLETEQANRAFRRVIGDFGTLFDTQPAIIAADLHPDYLSTKFADEVGRNDLPPGPDAQPRVPTRIGVQHHIAHVLSCIAENEVQLPVLGVAWDGTGYGTDGTIWGGEFFLVTDEQIERVAHLRPFPLPGGDAAVKEPRRAALGLLHELANGDDNLLSRTRQKVAGMFSVAERVALEVMLARGVNSPRCSSIGRLFDAVAALAGLRHQMRFEGQAAMELEFALDGVETDTAYELAIADCRLPIVRRTDAPLVLDWAGMVEAILADSQRGVSVGEISAKFHNALAEGIVSVAKEVGERRVALSGGCFQNRYLTERAVARLREAGFKPYWHQRVPTNDGGIALGQIVAARRELVGRGAAFTPLQQSGNGPLSIPNDALLTSWKRTEARVPSAPQRTQSSSRITHHLSR